MFSKRIQKIDSSEIRKVFDLASSLKNPINLSIGEPDFSIPKKVKGKLIEGIKKDFNKYTPTQGLLNLRKEVIKKLKDKNNIDAKLGNILITSGTSGALDLLFNVLFDEGDEVIILDPYFVIYESMIKFVGAKPVFINTYNSDFLIQPSEIKKKITKNTKAIILNSPANPTGAVYSEDIIKQIVKIAHKNNLYLISDEVYEDFIYEGNHFSPGSVYGNCFTLSGFSKSHAMTGLRCGYIYGPKMIIQEMAKLQQYTYVCAPSISQYGALAALNTDISSIIDDYKKKRDLIYDGIKDYFEVVKPKGAFYIFPKIPKKYESATEFTEKAIKNNLLIIPGNVFSQKDTHVRISFAADDDEIKKGVKVLRELAKKNKSF